MEEDGVTDVIDEAAIKKVMEDVGLRSVDVNSEASEPGDDAVSSCGNSNASSNGKDDELSGFGVSATVCEDNISNKCSLEVTFREGEHLARAADKASASKHQDKLCAGEASEEQQDEDTNETHDKEDTNLNGKLQSTPAALRRSSRTKLPTSPNPNDSITVGRTTRSQINPEIIAKQKSFMHKYQLAVKSSMDSYVRSAANEVELRGEHQAIKRKWEDTGGNESLQFQCSSPVQEKKCKKSILSTSAEPVVSHTIESKSKTVARHDTFCWTCHTDGQVLECVQCPRVFHQRCVQLQSPLPMKWVCTECVSIRNAEKHCPIDVDQLPVMLNFAMERIKSVADAQPFFKPVDTEEFPHYTEYVVFPVDISQLEDKISQGSFTSTRAFLADFRWILHNCIIFNSFHSKLTSTARTLMKVCKHEMAEIDTCADCYVHAHTKRETWFLEPCRRPHLLLWAKLKGFPHWPAKAMKANKEGNVDVRFFGAHDRAWVPAKDCFLYSREMPMHLKNQRKANLVASIEEVDQHIKKLVERYGSFAYPSPRTAYNPLKEDEQLQLLIPGYKVSGDSQNLLSCHMGESGETESMRSDSDTDTDSKPKDTGTDADRSEGRNFLAMLQLAPRSSADIAQLTTDVRTSPPSSPTSERTLSGATEVNTAVPDGSVNMPTKSQGKNAKPDQSSHSKMSCGDLGTEQPVNDSINLNESSCEVVKITKARVVSPTRKSSTSKPIVLVKTEPTDHGDENESVPGSQEAKSCSISLAIDNVVGNYKPSVGIKSKSETTFKSTPKSSGARLSRPGVKTTDQKPATKFSSKSNSVRALGAKTPSASRTNTKPLQTNRRQVGNEEEELDPAMYLDPTITITLINNEDNKKAVTKTISEMANVTTVNPISSSDLQALNALGENVSITVVPKKKLGVPATVSACSKENEAIDQPMVIEVDPVALQKSRIPGQIAKARKSFPKTRSVVQSGSQKSSQKHPVPPMVSIPSRHLGMEISRPPAVSKQSTSSRVPSITVRPVTQLVSAQPSIILQSSSSADVTSLGAMASALKQPTSSSTTSNTSSSNNSTNSPLTLNTMHTLGPDSGFGSGGLLLTFNRSLPAFAATSNTTSMPSVGTQNKNDVGPLSAQLSSRTNQIADMVRSTIETLLNEISSSGNLEATMIQLQLELERCRSQHQLEVSKLKKTLDSQQASAENDKQQALSELRRQMEAEKQRAIDEIKKKQWCAHCSQEAIFYCCWNTAYCDYPCQQAHWPKHMTTCANANQNTEVESNEAEACHSPSDSPIGTSAPSKSTATVNGSPNQEKKAFPVKTNCVSPIELGHPGLTFSDCPTPRSSSPGNSPSIRVDQQFSADEALSMSPTTTPVTSNRSSPVPIRSQPELHVSNVSFALPSAKCLKVEES